MLQLLLTFSPLHLFTCASQRSSATANRQQLSIAARISAYSVLFFLPICTFFFGIALLNAFIKSGKCTVCSQKKKKRSQRLRRPYILRSGWWLMGGFRCSLAKTKSTCSTKAAKSASKAKVGCLCRERKTQML